MIVAAVKKMFHLILLLLSPFKRVLCWMKRQRKVSGTLLPLANHYPAPTDCIPQQSVPSNDADIQLEPWDSWGVAEANHHAPRSHVDSTTVQAGAVYQRAPQRSQEEPEPDINYFEDMQPSIKRSKKIIIKKSGMGGHVTTDHNTGFSHRLGVASTISPIQGSELVEWEEGGSAWDDEVNAEDLSHQADLAIKEKKREEREQRQRESQKKKMEKQQRGRSGDSFTAIKLS